MLSNWSLLPACLLTGGRTEVVAISGETPLAVGDTALLTCLGFGERSAEISWTFNGALLTNTSLVNVYDRDVIKGGRVFKHSFLQICSVTPPDGGNYTCTVRSGISVVDATAQLTG